MGRHNKPKVAKYAFSDWALLATSVYTGVSVDRIYRVWPPRLFRIVWRYFSGKS